jgi:predicted GNAT family N-acyltransferase
MSIRNYIESDRTACLSVFDSNVPEYFGAHERPMFESYLADLRGPYLVIEDGREVVACGGMAAHESEPEAAKLCWGMVLRARHGTGLGKLLLFERLHQLNQNSSFRIVVLNTSQFSAGFFTKMGFETRRVVLDGYFAGMDRHEMSIRLPFQFPARSST